MLASDIPVGYRSAPAMARSLAKHLDCPEEIRKRVMGIFPNCPPRRNIIEMIEKHRRPEKGEAVQASDAYSAASEARGLAEVNKEFVYRLRIERAAMEMRRG